MDSKPGPELDAWVATSRKAKKMRITRVLYAEMPEESHSGGLLRPYHVPEQASRIESALRSLRERLRCRRYTVNRCQAKWRLYVIELDASKVRGMKPEHKDAVYVGETNLTREERAHIHSKQK